LTIVQVNARFGSATLSVATAFTNTLRHNLQVFFYPFS